MPEAPRIHFFVPLPDFIDDDDVEGYFKKDVLPYPPLPIGTYVDLGGMVAGTVSRHRFAMGENENEIEVDIEVHEMDPKYFFEYFRDPRAGWEEQG